MQEVLKINEEYEVTIPKQDHFGNGIVRIKDIIVFVSNCVSGDVCKIIITDVKKKFAYAEVKELITPSKDRVIPSCPYYDVCGGCHIMHQEYSKQLQFKEQKVIELLERFTNLDSVKINPIIGKNPFYYRNKVTFHGKDNHLGFYKEKTNELVEIDKCIITNTKLNDIYKKILNFLDDNKSSKITDLVLKVTSFDEVLVSIKGTVNKDKILSYLDEVATIYINDKLVKGNSYIVEEIFGMKFRIYPNSFFQVNYDMMKVLYKKVIDFYKGKDYEKVLDLYCGTGTIGILVSKYVEKVIGVEVEHSSIISANVNKEENKITNIEFVEGKVEDKIDLFQDVDSIIVDPPRSGLDKHTIDIILKLHPQTISYISCDPVTLARDLKILLNDYDLLEVNPVDMFPNTYHVENVAFLKKKKNF